MPALAGALLTAGQLHATNASAAASGTAVHSSAAGATVRTAVPAGRWRPLPRRFLGFSWETWTVPFLAGWGAEPAAPLLNLMASLGGNGGINLRIGGDSQDRSFWTSSPGAGRLPAARRPVSYETLANQLPAARGSRYLLTPAWTDVLSRVVNRSDSTLILGLNLANSDAAGAGQLARNASSRIATRLLIGLEVGNEPSRYNTMPAHWLRTAGGYRPTSARRRYEYGDLVEGWSRYGKTLRRGGLGRLALAGPGLGCPGMRWCDQTGDLYMRFRRSLRIGTTHLYSIQPPRWNSRPSDPGFPTRQRLLSDANTADLAARISRQVTAARRARIPLRVDEFNTTCFGGTTGLSDRFASALWAVSAMFSLGQSGVAGINMHFGYGTWYRPFWIDWRDGTPRALVSPLFYGMKMFADATRDSVRIARARINPAGRNLDIWMIKPRSGGERAVIVNRSAWAKTVVIGSRGSGPAAVARLTAHSIASAGGVTWKGMAFGSDGLLHGSERLDPIAGRSGRYSVPMPAGSAALLYLPPS